MRIRHRGYNIFAVGHPGTGKRTITDRVLREYARTLPTPDDWCYVADLDDDSRAKALRLPPGRGQELKRTVDTLLDDLLLAVPAAFESADYLSRRRRLEVAYDARAQEAFDDVRDEARDRGLAIVNETDGVRFVPGRGGDPLEAVELDALTLDQRSALEDSADAMRPNLDLAARSSRGVLREGRRMLRELDRETARAEIAWRVADAVDGFRDVPDATAFLESLTADMAERFELFLADDEEEAGPFGPDRERYDRREALTRYRVNVFVEHAPDSGAPVVFEPHPTVGGVLGRIEHRQLFGILTTDFTMIRPGALHKANGGFLVVPAVDLLRQSGSWEALKRALKTQEVRIELPEDGASPVTPVTLEAQPIGFEGKVVVVGEPDLYYALFGSDPDLQELFKVQAEFADSMPRTAESELLYARLIHKVAGEEDLLPFQRDAVGRVVEFGARTAEDTRRLSTCFLEVTDLLREADFWARSAGLAVVDAAAVDTAYAERIRRADLTREIVQESFARDVVRIETAGTQVGQANGLTVYSVGEFDFGAPVRITARVRQGGGEIVDIEREVDLGGPLHSKGVLVLTGFLSGRYLVEDALAIAASITFEQSGSEIDGDSASLAELCALLSAVAAVPIDQGWGLTGAVDQTGAVLAVGGVNEKIEGFYDVCQARGLTGGQGVLIPAANTQHLMLRPDVVAAAARGDFGVIAVETVDEAMEVLTGLRAGERSRRGPYPAGTLNRLVEDRLGNLAERRRDSGQPEESPQARRTKVS